MTIPHPKKHDAPGQGSEVGKQDNTQTEDTTYSQSCRYFQYYAEESVIGRVLGALLRGERLTGKDCWLRFGSSRLSHHIHRLGRDGWRIDRIDLTVATSDAKRKATIAEYWLAPDVIHEAGEPGQRFAAAALREEIRRRAA